VGRKYHVSFDLSHNGQAMDGAYALHHRYYRSKALNLAYLFIILRGLRFFVISQRLLSLHNITPA
jgi:hypothetical protein